MEVLEDDGKRVVVLSLIAREPGGEHHEQWAKPLAPAPDDVAADMGDERNAGAEVLFDLPFDPFEIVFHLAEDGGRMVGWGCRSMSRGQDGSSSTIAPGSRLLAESSLIAEFARNVKAIRNPQSHRPGREDGPR